MSPFGFSPEEHTGRQLTFYILISLILILIGSFLLGGVTSWLGARFADLLFAEHSSGSEEDLKAIIAELMLENASLKEDAIKSERYLELLGMIRISAGKVIAGRVLYRTEGLTTGSLVIDRGERDGVTQNSVCLASEGLLGIVTDVMEAQCIVLPINSPQILVSCITYPSGAVGIVQTGTSGNLEMVNVDLSSRVLIGEQVLTSRYGGVYPDGLLVGFVTAVHGNEMGLEYKLDIDASVDFKRTNEVLILISEN